mmetsp:Transcript_38471/g.124185  ORF Transcript_38471/g.124185 Transcript_38471/m.124185 type:complete len:701 (-) Transcript_38471:3028-5130(-)
MITAPSPRSPVQRRGRHPGLGHATGTPAIASGPLHRHRLSNHRTPQARLEHLGDAGVHGRGDAREGLGDLRLVLRLDEQRLVARLRGCVEELLADRHVDGADGDQRQVEVGRRLEEADAAARRVGPRPVVFAVCECHEPLRRRRLAGELLVEGEGADNARIVEGGAAASPEQVDGAEHRLARRAAGRARHSEAKLGPHVVCEGDERHAVPVLHILCEDRLERRLAGGQPRAMHRVGEVERDQHHLGQPRLLGRRPPAGRRRAFGFAHRPTEVAVLLESARRVDKPRKIRAAPGLCVQAEPRARALTNDGQADQRPQGELRRLAGARHAADVAVREGEVREEVRVVVRQGRARAEGERLLDEQRDRADNLQVRVGGVRRLHRHPVPVCDRLHGGNAPAREHLGGDALRDGGHRARAGAVLQHLVEAGLGLGRAGWLGLEVPERAVEQAEGERVDEGGVALLGGHLLLDCRDGRAVDLADLERRVRLLHACVRRGERDVVHDRAEAAVVAARLDQVQRRQVVAQHADPRAVGPRGLAKAQRDEHLLEVEHEGRELAVGRVVSVAVADVALVVAPAPLLDDPEQPAQRQGEAQVEPDREADQQQEQHGDDGEREPHAVAQAVLDAILRGVGARGNLVGDDRESDHVRRVVNRHVRVVPDLVPALVRIEPRELPDAPDAPLLDDVRLERRAEDCVRARVEVGDE